MTRFVRLAAVAVTLVLSAPAALPAQPMAAAQQRPDYPPTRRDAIVDERFGESVPDPYRWLEGDPRKDPQVAAWAGRQDAFARAWLAKLPGRDELAKRIRKLTDIDRFSLPKKADGRYFYTHNSGLQDQSPLYVREGLAGPERLLVDPNRWSADGTVALDDWEPSPDGRLLAYSIQRDGSDMREIRVLRVADGKPFADRLAGAADVPIAWVDGEGFLYSRYPAPAGGAGYGAPRAGAGVWYHRAGTPQDEDVAVYVTPGASNLTNRARVSSDGRWAVIASTDVANEKVGIHVIDLRRRERDGWRTRVLVAKLRNDWHFVEGIGRHLWFITNLDAPRYRLVRFDLGRRKAKLKQVVAEGQGTLERGRIVGDRLILSYRSGGVARAGVFSLSGQPRTSIALDAIGTASGFVGKPGDPESFYSFSSFNLPPGVWRIDLSTGAIAPFALPKVPFDPSGFLVERYRYRSKDGTMVPLYLVRSRAVARAGKPVPTLLYGYGGFDVSINPGYSPERMAWLLSGGAFALASVRGGGELGEAWHDAGRRANKQNAFDDFIAAAQWLVAQGVAPRRGIAAQGSSNGGLLVAASVNQRPDLFGAANPDVGVFDMLRFDRFTAGRFWMADYGDPSVEADWRVLRAYSPYHNIHAGDYPAILVTTADHDDRVVPAHSFKYVAALQAADTGPLPKLLRIEHEAGHGTGKPTAMVIAESADVLAFLAHYTGLEIGAPGIGPSHGPGGSAVRKRQGISP